MIYVYLIDILWTGIALLGILVSLWAVIDSGVDRDVLQNAKDYHAGGHREAIVRINLRSARASLLLHTFFLILGALAFAAPMRTRPDLFYILLASGYILVAVTNVRAVGLNQLDRLRLRKNA